LKVWIITTIEGDGSEEKPYRPNLWGLNLPYSWIKINDTTALARVSGKPDDIKTLIGTEGVKVLKDSEALDLIRKIYPNADLESFNVYDPELDDIAKRWGYDPTELRKAVQIPIDGRSVLTSQERNVIACLAVKLGVKVGDLEEDVDKGSKHAYNRALARLRGKTGLRDIYKV